MNSLRKYSLAGGVFYLLTFVSIPTLSLYRLVRGPGFVLGPGPDTPVIVGVLLEMIVALKTNEATKGISLLGYVSHVQGELKQKAHDSGCDMVMARSAFSLNLPQILKRHAGAA